MSIDVEGQRKALVRQAFAVQAAYNASFFKRFHGTLYQKPRPDASFYVSAVPAVYNNRFDPRIGQKLG